MAFKSKKATAILGAKKRDGKGGMADTPYTFKQPKMDMLTSEISIPENIRRTLGRLKTGGVSPTPVGKSPSISRQNQTNDILPYSKKIKNSLARY